MNTHLCTFAGVWGRSHNCRLSWTWLDLIASFALQTGSSVPLCKFKVWEIRQDSSMESGHTENRSFPRHTHLAGNPRSSRAEGWSYWNQCGRRMGKSLWAAFGYKSWTAPTSAEPPDVLLFHWMTTRFLWFLAVFNHEKRNARTSIEKPPLTKDFLRHQIMSLIKCRAKEWIEPE